MAMYMHYKPLFLCGLLFVLAVLFITCAGRPHQLHHLCNLQVRVVRERDSKGRENLRCVDGRLDETHLKKINVTREPVVWHKNELPHTDSKRVYSIGERLIFKEVLASDEGNWTCNSNGSISPPFPFYAYHINGEYYYTVILSVV